MEAIRYFTRVQSDTICIPDLKDLLGRDVEIIVIDNQKKAPEQGLGPFFSLAGNIDLDEETITGTRQDSMI
jgi:hypothetical protein